MLRLKVFNIQARVLANSPLQRPRRKKVYHFMYNPCSFFYRNNGKTLGFLRKKSVPRENKNDLEFYESRFGIDVLEC